MDVKTDATGELAWSQRQGRLGFISISYILGSGGGTETIPGEMLPMLQEGALEQASSVMQT